MSTLTVNRANIQNVTVNNNTKVTKVNGGSIATNKEIKDGVSTTKIVTPYSAKLALSLFATLGNANTNATFTDITATDFGGDVIADTATALAGVSSNTIITPATLAAVFQSPPRFGLVAPNNAIFSALTMNSVAGDVLATANEVAAGTVNNKMVSPIAAYYALQSPPAIGGYIPNSASFTDVSANSITLGNSLLQVAQGGLNMNTFSRGDLLVASDTTVISKLPAGRDGQFLQADSTVDAGMKWVDNPVPPQSESITGANDTEALDSSVNTKALVPSNLPALFGKPYDIGGTSKPDAIFTTLTTSGALTVTNTIGPASGATGITSYNKGDILVATDPTTFSTLPVAGTGKYLTADSTNPLGIKWATVAGFSTVSGFPYGYFNLGPVTQVSGIKTQYSIAYLFAKNAANNGNIAIANQQIIDLYSFLSSSALAGTVQTYGRRILGTNTAFRTTVNPGDFININKANLKVTSVISDVELIVEKPCVDQGSANIIVATPGCQISTSSSKFGSSSLLVNGNNSITFSGISNIVREFTIEFWLNIRSLNAAIPIINMSGRSDQLTINTNWSLVFTGAASNMTSRILLRPNTWQHIAWSCNGNNTYLFINGKLALDLSKMHWQSDMYFWNNYLSLFNNSTSTYYVDELRISNMGRYTDEFTPQDTPFTVGPYTILLHHFDGTNGATNLNALEETQITGAGNFTYSVNKSFDFTSQRLYLYAYAGNTSGYMFHYLNSSAGDDLTTIGLTSYVQLPYCMDLNVNGIPNKYGLIPTKFSAPNYGALTVNSGCSAIMSYKTKDSLGKNSVQNNKNIDLSTTFIDTGSLPFVYNSVVLSGTVSTDGSTTITGTSTQFSTDFAVGDSIFIINSQQKLTVTAITNDTTLIVGAAANTISGASYYKIMTTTPSPIVTTLAGSVSVNGTSVTGSGTTFTNDLAVGDLISVSNGGASYVKAITSDTSLTLANNICLTKPSASWANTLSSLSATQAKFGNTSLAVNGAGAQISVTTVVPQDLYEYTLECWAYVPATFGTIMSYTATVRGYGYNTVADTMNLSVVTGGQLSFSKSTNFAGNNQTINQSSLGVVSTGAWHHFAICQNQFIIKIFLDGTQKYSFATNYFPSPEAFTNISFGNNFTNGYIDEFRFSKVMRYNANFTPASSAFTLDAETLVLKHFEGTNGQTNLSDSDDYVSGLTGQTVQKIVRTHPELALRSPLYAFGKCVFGIGGSNFRTDIKQGDQLYLPSMNKLSTVTNVLADDTLFVSDYLTSQSNVNNVKWSAVGAAYLSSFQKRFGGSSLFIDGYAGPAQSCVAVDSFPMSYILSGGGNWTVEFWFLALATGPSADTVLFSSKYSTTSNNMSGKSYRIMIDTSNQVYLHTVGQASTKQLIILNNWNHVAAVASGATVTLYVNGISVGSIAYTIDPSSLATFNIGGHESNAWRPLNGFIDEFRVSNIARYSAAFSPPTTRFRSDQNTLLLNHFDGPDGATDFTLADESVSDYALSNIFGYARMGWAQNNNSVTQASGAVTITGSTVYGTNTTFKTSFGIGDQVIVGNRKYKISDIRSDTSMSINNTNSFPLIIPYGTAALSSTRFKFGSSSLLLNGTTDYISIGNTNRQLFNASYTVEAFVYCVSLSAINTIAYITKTGYTGSILLQINTNGTVTATINDASGSVTLTSTATIAAATWSHVSLGYNGLAYILSVNGNVSSTVSAVMFNYIGALNIQLGRGVTSNYLNGNLDEFRVSTIARYPISGTFTVPATAFVQDAFTALGLHFEDTFMTANQLFTPVGEIALNSGQSKFGSAGSNSLYFGTTGLAYVALSPLPVPTSWTIECWVYPTATNQNMNVLFGAKLAGSNCGISVQNNAGTVSMYLGSTMGLWNIANNSGPVALPNNVWSHIAVSYDGTNYRFFGAGTLRSTVASTLPIYPQAWANLLLGDASSNSGGTTGVFKAVGSSFIGYMDELRISNVCRYTATFTPSTTQFSADANTIVLHHFKGTNLQLFSLPATSHDIYYGAPNIFSSYFIQKPTRNNSLYTYIASATNKSQQIVLSTANTNAGETLVSLPVGYTAVKQLPYVFTYNIDGNLHRVVITNKKLRYIYKPRITIFTPNASTWYPVDLSHFIPSHITSIECSVSPLTGSSMLAYLSANSNGANARTVNTADTTNSRLLIWLDASDASTVTIANGAISTWADKSGNNYNASPSIAGTTGPTYSTGVVNGLNVVTYSASTNRFMYIPTGPGLIQQFVLFMVLSVSSTNSSFAASDSSVNATNGLTLSTNASNYIQYVVTGGSAAIVSTTVPSTATTILTIVDTISSATIFMNGTQIATGTSTSNIANRNFSVFDIGGYASTPIVGRIGEVRVYAGTMATNERAQIEASLGAKWGISVTSSASRAGNSILAPVSNGKMYLRSEASSVGLTLHGYNMRL
jgi:hypothetical protein